MPPFVVSGMRYLLLAIPSFVRLTAGYSVLPEASRPSFDLEDLVCYFP
jgi:hypothetical protein